MRSVVVVLLICGLWMPFTALAQQTIITGQVVDSQTQRPIPFTHIFIANTSSGTTANDEGKFQFLSDDLGEADVVLSFTGYETQRKHIVYSKEAVDVGIIELDPSEMQLDDVVVMSVRDAAWEKDLKKFKNLFLGKDEFAAACTIENPHVLNFETDDATRTFTAKAAVPLKITNRALGYEISFFLKKMTSNTEGNSIEGDAFFGLLQATSQAELDLWAKNRETQYNHSLTNLLRSIVEHNINERGFSLYTEKDVNAPFKRASRFGDNLGKTVERADTVALMKPQPGTDKFIISFKGRLEAHYRNEKARTKAYNDLTYSVSWLALKSDAIVVNSQGIPSKPMDLDVSGAMSQVQVAGMLPLDYFPGGTDDRERQLQVATALPYFYEQIYVQTDKPYYYAGEQLWFKGYINYMTQSFRDSLSRTVYVDFITPQRKILLTKTLLIDSGRFSGQLELPIGTDAGTYNFRAYTNLQRNFNDSLLFVKPVPVLELKDFVEKVPAKEVAQSGVLITTSKEKYKTREKIEVKVKLTDEKGRPIRGDLSMTVTDVKQVSPIKVSPDILERYPIRALPALKPSVAKKPFVVEYGITVNGQFLNNAGKPQRAEVNVVQMNPRDLILTESDANGRFTINHLGIYDSARFSITATDSKGKAYGRGIILPNDKPMLIYKKLKDSLRIATATSAQRDVSKFDMSGEVRMLDEVEVRAKRIREEDMPDFRFKRPYGRATYALTSKDFNASIYPNMMMLIQGRFPGLIVRQALNADDIPRWVVYLVRNEKGSLYNMKEVTVTVNDNVMSGTPESILSLINPSTVEAVELRTGINVLYGSLANNGILSIYLKDGSEIGREPAKTIGTVSAPGYTFSPSFTSPDYDTDKGERADYRSLIFWSPYVPFWSDGLAAVSFFSADLITTYRIEVEGVTDEGKPVHAVKTIEIGN